MEGRPKGQYHVVQWSLFSRDHQFKKPFARDPHWTQPLVDHKARSASCANYLSPTGCLKHQPRATYVVITQFDLPKKMSTIREQCWVWIRLLASRMALAPRNSGFHGWGPQPRLVERPEQPGRHHNLSNKSLGSLHHAARPQLVRSRDNSALPR